MTKQNKKRYFKSVAYMILFIEGSVETEKKRGKKKGRKQQNPTASRPVNLEQPKKVDPVAMQHAMQLAKEMSEAVQIPKHPNPWGASQTVDARQSQEAVYPDDLMVEQMKEIEESLTKTMGTDDDDMQGVQMPICA